MKTTKVDLAAVFTRIEKAAAGVEDVAKGILAAVKAAKASQLEQFNDMVAAAYGANGWSQKAGRPSAGSTEKPAPDAVKLYVSTIRAAYRMHLKVMTFETVGALRTALREARGKGIPMAPKAPQLRGIQVTSDSSMTGALWHDAVVLWDNLPEASKVAMETRIRRLISQFTKDAPPALSLAA